MLANKVGQVADLLRGGVDAATADLRMSGEWRVEGIAPLSTLPTLHFPALMVCGRENSHAPNITHEAIGDGEGAGSQGVQVTQGHIGRISLGNGHVHRPQHLVAVQFDLVNGLVGPLWSAIRGGGRW